MRTYWDWYNDMFKVEYKHKTISNIKQLKNLVGIITINLQYNEMILKELLQKL